MGYIGQSRSERSQMAIERGMLTKSQLKAWQKRAVEAGAVKPCEWHHTGKYFNKTDYYDPADFNKFTAKDFPPVKSVGQIKDEKWYVLVSANWGGTKRHPRIEGYTKELTNKVTARQMDAKKYNDYGGYIKVFETREEGYAYYQSLDF